MRPELSGDGYRRTASGGVAIEIRIGLRKWRSDVRCCGSYSPAPSSHYGRYARLMQLQTIEEAFHDNPRYCESGLGAPY